LSSPKYSIILGKCSNLNMFYSIIACLSQTFMPSSTFLQIWLNKLDGNKSEAFTNLFISCNILKSLKKTWPKQVPWKLSFKPRTFTFHNCHYLQIWPLIFDICNNIYIYIYIDFKNMSYCWQGLTNSFFCFKQPNSHLFMLSIKS